MVYAGRLDTLKGIDSLAVAFESLSIRYPNLRLILAGSGDFRLVHEKVKYACSKITFTGLVDKKTLYELYSIADIGILPSLYEELGYVALEMMMMNLPVIVGNNSGLKEVVGDDKNGVLVPLHCCYGKVGENALFLERAIIQLISSISLQREIANNGRKRYQSYFNLDHFYKSYIRILTNKSV